MTEYLNQMKFVVGHPRRHHLYHTALAYQEVGRLARWVTEVFAARGPGSALLRVVGNVSPRVRRLLNYSCASLDEYALVVQSAYTARLIFNLLGCRVVGGDWTDAVVREADAAAAGVHLPCVNAVQVFDRLRSRGRPLFLDQYIADRRQGRELLLEEADALGMKDALVLDAQGFGSDRILMNETEYTLADKIVAGSEFVRGTLLKHGIPASKVVVAEYGVDVDRWPYRERRRCEGQPLEVAFIGNGALRKGLLRLLRAAKQAGNVRVQVFGNVADLSGGVGPWEDVAVFHGHVPQVDLCKQLRRCHAFALPSLWEGSAYVVGEAMASGMPVIVTPNAGSWARDQVDGFVVSLRDESGLARAIRAMMDEDMRIEFGRKARDNAMAHTWFHYREQIRHTLLA